MSMSGKGGHESGMSGDGGQLYRVVCHVREVKYTEEYVR